ncbi:MAG TPA: nucleotidyl transferase AbiEii/AbiGii toxin family protein [Bacteroidia bacterium]|jgi:predicted nucleotidyltransferase component of viral defense system|nr:nucleotidyl transferase AbiEii/AbiGii toxin family protein [Bacteroidia bacterium]
MLQTDAVPAGTMDILEFLAKQPCLQDFYLGGGTSLALQIGHRLSVDLDFFTSHKKNINDIEYELLFIEGIKINARSNYALFTEFRGVKVDILNYPYKFISEPIKYNGITLCGKDDICAMKLKTVMNRGAKKDFYDIYFLLQEYSFTKMMELFEKKYANIEPNAIIRSLTYFEDAEEQENPVLLKEVSLSWEKVKQTIISEIRKIV